MKLFTSGFTFIKNGLELGYPIRESIESIAPLCDEIIINIGFDTPSLSKDDGTYDYLKSSFPQSKFIFFKSFWDPQIQKSGLILSQQTNLALAKCRGSICQYIQGDEVVHEKELQQIENGIKKLHDRKNIHGLVFDYYHFYGNPAIIKHSREIYRREVRTFKNFLKIQSYLDAQGFRFQDGSKLKCIKSNAHIFHYGWTRKLPTMAKKVRIMDEFYHGKNCSKGNSFKFQNMWGLKKFTGTHPAIMSDWIGKNDNNNIEILDTPFNFEWKHIGHSISDIVEKYTDVRPWEFKNYKLIR